MVRRIAPARANSLEIRAGSGYIAPTMPQQPQVRAKKKRRDTKRLAAWRAKQDKQEQREQVPAKKA